MASILKVDELQGIATTGDITVTSEGGAATQSLQQGLAKAWCHTSDDVIDDSLNFSSSTDNGTGDYTVNFTNSMANVTYASTASPCEGGFRFIMIYSARTSTNGHGLYIGTSGSVANDHNVMAQTHGDLA